MTDVTWHFNLAWGTLLGGVVFLALAVWTSVLEVRKHGNAPGFMGLHVLRLVIAVLLAATLLQPEQVRQTRLQEKPRIAVLCDASASMATRDVRTKASGVIPRSAWLDLQRQAPAWAPLAQRYEVQVDDFAAMAASNSPDADPGTDINLALTQAGRQFDALRAIVLLSDGDWNKGQSPVVAATALSLRDVPVFAVAVGSDTYLPDLELQSVTAPAYGLIDEHIAVPFTVQSHLGRDVKTMVTVSGPGGLRGSREVLVPAMGQVQDSVLVVPRQEGDFELTVGVPVEKEEEYGENNRRKIHLAVRREVLKVLLIDSVPRWEYRFLHNALARDPGAQVNCLLLQPEMGPGGGKDYLAAFPSGKEELSRYDVIFLGDIGKGPGELTEENLRLLKGMVEQQGSGLVFLPGRLGRQRTLVDSALMDLLPVVLPDDRPEGSSSIIEGRLELTARGQDHLLTMLASDAMENAAVWKHLPGFFWYMDVVRAKSGSEVLAVHSVVRNEHGRMPLLVTRSCGNGKVLFMGTDSAWRWRRGVEDTYHYRFWGQVIRWMSHQRHLAQGDGIRFFYSPESPQCGQRVFLHATAFDASGFPLQTGTVEALVSTANGEAEKVTLVPEAGGWGVFTGGFVPKQGGRHDVVIACEETGRKVRASVVVAIQGRERPGRPARSEVLREIAAITQGECVGTDQMESLVQRIALLPEPRPLEKRFRLWCHPAWCGLIIVLLGIYWVARKLAGRV